MSLTADDAIPEARTRRGIPPLEHAVSRGDRVRDALQEAILNGALQQGAPLVERELAKMLGVSKTPVREALKQLQSTGLVVANAYQGVSVRRLDAQTVRDVFQARLVVEPQAVRMAVELRGACPNEGAQRALDDARRLLHPEHAAQLGLANRRFHRELYRRCGNDLLIDFLDKTQVLTAFLATAGWRLDATYGSEADEHAELLDAVESGAAEEAEHLVRQHILGASVALMHALDREAE